MVVKLKNGGLVHYNLFVLDLVLYIKEASAALPAFSV